MSLALQELTTRDWPIELKFDATLKGMPGKTMSEADVHGRPIKFSKERYIEVVDGYDIFLTLDETIQFLLRKP